MTDRTMRLEKEMTEARHTQPIGGVDHGAPGRILVEVRRGNAVHARMVWFRGYMTASTGVRGFGREYVPAALRLIDGRGLWKADILQEGRLSRRRMLDHAADIDRVLGEGVADAVRIGHTLVVQEPHDRTERGDDR